MEAVRALLHEPSYQANPEMAGDRGDPARGDAVGIDVQAVSATVQPGFQ
jgi:hypothetical protein